MVDQDTGFRELLLKHGINCPTFQCIIHQDALCGKALAQSSTMNIVNRILNLIRGVDTTHVHKKFKTFLQDVNSMYRELYLDEELRWLNNADILKRFFQLRDDIAEFLQNEVKVDATDVQEKFDDIEFLSELAFLTDIACHLNELNSCLQKQNQTISDLVGYVKEFQNHLQLFINEIETNRLHSFPSCGEIARQYSTVNFSVFRTWLIEIQQQFQRHFHDFDLLSNDLEIFNNPKGCEIINQGTTYQLELCGLQSDSFLLGRDEYGLEFFKLLSKEKYPKLTDFSLRLYSMLGSTYKCGSSFSIMKHVKSTCRSKLTNDSLCSLLRIATTSIPVDTASLTTEMIRPQISH